jgi:hypothetical protein
LHQHLLETAKNDAELVPQRHCQGLRIATRRSQANSHPLKVVAAKPNSRILDFGDAQVVSRSDSISFRRYAIALASNNVTLGRYPAGQVIVIARVRYFDDPPVEKWQSKES